MVVKIWGGRWSKATSRATLDELQPENGEILPEKSKGFSLRGTLKSLEKKGETTKKQGKSEKEEDKEIQKARLGGSGLASVAERLCTGGQELGQRVPAGDRPVVRGFERERHRSWWEAIVVALLVRASRPNP